MKKRIFICMLLACFAVAQGVQAQRDYRGRDLSGVGGNPAGEDTFMAKVMEFRTLMQETSGANVDKEAAKAKLTKFKSEVDALYSKLDASEKEAQKKFMDMMTSYINDFVADGAITIPARAGETPVKVKDSQLCSLYGMKSATNAETGKLVLYFEKDGKPTDVVITGDGKPIQDYWTFSSGECRYNSPTKGRVVFKGAITYWGTQNKIDIGKGDFYFEDGTSLPNIYDGKLYIENGDCKKEDMTLLTLLDRKTETGVFTCGKEVSFDHFPLNSVMLRNYGDVFKFEGTAETVIFKDPTNKNAETKIVYIKDLKSMTSESGDRKYTIVDDSTVVLKLTNYNASVKQEDVQSATKKTKEVQSVQNGEIVLHWDHTKKCAEQPRSFTLTATFPEYNNEKHTMVFKNNEITLDNKVKVTGVEIWDCNMTTLAGDYDGITRWHKGPQAPYNLYAYLTYTPVFSAKYIIHANGKKEELEGDLLSGTYQGKTYVPSWKKLADQRAETWLIKNRHYEDRSLAAIRKFWTATPIGAAWHLGSYTYQRYKIGDGKGTIVTVCQGTVVNQE